MKQINKKGEKNQTGALGEEIAANYLRKRGFKIVEQNYLKKWGEIDIVAHETENIHFVEVKTVSYETKSDLISAILSKTYRPEENVHNRKLIRLNRAIESWLIENNFQGEWRLDVIAVRVVPRERYSTVKYIENVIV